MIHFVSFVTAGLLASLVTAFPISEQLNDGDHTIVHSFEAIKPSSDLVWVPCYDFYHCANLKVPLDYANPSAGMTVVAWIRQNAVNGTGQDILYNPGGPGGSGISTVLQGSGGDLIDALGGKYNLVTFDPRGVNNSGIELTCFPNNTVARNGYADLSEARQSWPLNEQYYQAVAKGHWCTEANINTNAKYVGTSAVVQDMIHFTELQAALNGDKQPKQTKIWYYGASYGTIIGQTLASMFPGRVGRVIIDGNVNGEDYYDGATPTGIEDTDKVFAWFFQSCAEAGPEKCLFAGNSTTAQEVRRRFNALLDKLQQEPIIINIPGFEEEPAIITRSRALTFATLTMYQPLSSWPVLSQAFAGLEAGNGTLFKLFETVLQHQDGGPKNYTEKAMDEALTLITSVDAAGHYSISDAKGFINVAEQVTEDSFYAGRLYATTNVLNNAGMALLPPDSQTFQGFRKINTSNPLLFINPTADPVTPLSSAEHMAQYFDGSVVLVQNSPGHTHRAVPSTCTKERIVAYLENGTLPQVGTVCEIDAELLVNIFN